MPRTTTTFLRRLLHAATPIASLLLAAAAPPAAAQPLPPVLVNGCSSQSPAACVYRSPNGPFTPGVVDLYLEDPARGNHPVPLRVRYPVGATGARPVVIWSHGGQTTTVDPGATAAAGFTVTRGQQGSLRRSESFARAGYVVIHIGRLDVPALSQAQLQDCLAAGAIAGGIVSPDATALSACRTWTGWHVEGPRNVAFVVSMLQHYRAGMLPGFAGTLDRERIVVGGWSGGTESALNIAGAYQRWNSLAGVGTVTLQPTEVPGVVAFFADAPRGPAWAGFSSGFQEDSAYGIDGRPFLFNTARDDRGPDGGPVVSRTSSYFGAARGGKVLAYGWTPAAQGGPNHATMDLADQPGEDGCNTALRADHCDWLETLGVAFLDAAVLGLPGALQWITSDNLRVLSGDRIELSLR